MESSTEAGALGVSAAATVALPGSPHTSPADGMMPFGEEYSNAVFSPFEQEQPTFPGAPETPHPAGERQQSDAREARPDTPNTERVANILANGPLQVPDEAAGLTEGFDTAAMTRNQAHESVEQADFPVGIDTDGWPAREPDAFASQDAQGFAKLMFPDGDYIVTTHDVEIGRNMEIFAQYKRHQKQAKREREQEKRKERVNAVQQERAQRELEEYQQEPSQPSLTGDDRQHADASNSSHSLEGRPAAQTTFSESGGALAFLQDSDEEAGSKRGRKKRRSMQYSKSSTSTTSVVPANLHPPVISAEYSQQELFTEDGEPYSRTLATLPIHTQQPEDIRKISKKHLLFSFNFPDERWELHIIGMNAFVNEMLFERGDIIPLNHNDEIQVSSLMITFKLPDSHRNSPGLSRGTFSQVGLEDNDDLSGDEAGAAGTSPVRRLSNAFEDAITSDDEPTGPKKAVPKLKLKGLKKQQKEKKSSGSKQKPQEEEKAAHKISLKKQQPRPSEQSPSPDAEKKPEKGKKPKEAAKQPPEPNVAEAMEAPPAPPVFTAEPGSALASVPLDELPQKRKGPGRPPKNGLVSKRDQALVKKKEREYEKSGMVAPPFNKLLDMVRAETKQKEVLAKMQSGSLPPNTELPPAVEIDFTATAAKAPVASTPTPNDDQTGSLPPDPARRPSSPRPKRVARSPSPMKPESAYSEEELKKPSATYVHILDEILRDHPSGHADLQEIYDRIQKRYPFFKYRVNTQGWQSSVRHNLLSAPRFKETGRSGKGKLWTIDHDVPLEREKKKKPTPPPRPNIAYAPYGPIPFGVGYGPGQRPPNAPPGYLVPYPGQQNAGPMANQQASAAAAQLHHAQEQMRSDPFGGLVPEILHVRSAFLQPYTDPLQMTKKSDWISKCVHVFSNRFHGSGRAPDLKVASEDEKQAYEKLDAIFKKYEVLKEKREQEKQDAKNAQFGQQGAAPAAPAQASPLVRTGSQTAPQEQDQQTVQTAVADGVAHQNANSGLSSSTPQAAEAPSGSNHAALQSSNGQPLVYARDEFAGQDRSPSVQAVPPPSAAQDALVTSASPSVGSTVSTAPPPHGLPYAPPPGNQWTAQADRAPAAPQTHGNGNAQHLSQGEPGQTGLSANVQHQHSPFDNSGQVRPPQQATASTNGPSPPVRPSMSPAQGTESAQPLRQSVESSTGLPQPPQQSSASGVNHPPTFSPVQSEQTPSLAAQPEPSPVASTGTKRAAEDDPTTETEAKRAKIDEE